MDKAHLKFIIRDFVNEGLTEKGTQLKSIAKDPAKASPGSTTRFTVQQHRDMKMKQVLDCDPEIIDNLSEAVRRAGLTPATGSYAAAPTASACP